MLDTVIKTPVLKVLTISLIFYTICMWTVFQSRDKNKTVLVEFFTPKFFTVEKKFNYLVNTKGCQIPDMDPFDVSIRKYLYQLPKRTVMINGTIHKYTLTEDEDESVDRPIRCSKEHPPLPPLIISNLTHLIVDKNSLRMHNLTVIHCCYTPFWRPVIDESDDTKTYKNDNIDDESEMADNCVDFTGKEAFVGNNEFVVVYCYLDKNKTKNIYTDFHSFTPIKDYVEEDCNQSLKNSGGKSDKFSVLLFGVDAVSRLNFLRQMPKTYNYIINILKGVEMYGYNKVGDNTFPNLVPVLSGFNIAELKKICWHNNYDFFDECPFIWKQYRKSGFRTCFAEDSSWMGIFSYGKSGFLRPPTDYYWKPFNIRAEQEIGWDKRLNSELCIGYRMSTKVLLDYTEKFVSTMSNKLFFSFIWGTSMSHDFLNLPRYGDEMHSEFLHRLNKSGILKNCIIIFMSDHGIRWGGLRKTYQGYLEERLPFLYFVFPERFRKKYTTAVGNMKRNAHMLTSPYDLHETLSDLLNLERLEKNYLKQRINQLYTKVDRLPRGISLFLTVPPDRTCRDAGISNHWCTCHTSKEVNSSSPVIKEVANFVIKEMNLLINGYKCAILRLKQIISARQRYAKISKADVNNLKKLFYDYEITIEVLPSNGIFEATIRQKTDDTFQIMGTISRTNVYGNQSTCMADYRLKLYCYCI